jgi:hypothetical protein
MANSGNGQVNQQPAVVNSSPPDQSGKIPARTDASAGGSKEPAASEGRKEAVEGPTVGGEKIGGKRSLPDAADDRVPYSQNYVLFLALQWAQ